MLKYFKRMRDYIYNTTKWYGMYKWSEMIFSLTIISPELTKTISWHQA